MPGRDQCKERWMYAQQRKSKGYASPSLNKAKIDSIACMYAEESVRRGGAIHDIHRDDGPNRTTCQRAFINILQGGRIISIPRENPLRLCSWPSLPCPGTSVTSFPHDSKDPGDSGQAMIWGPKSGKSGHHYSVACLYYFKKKR